MSCSATAAAAATTSWWGRTGGLENPRAAVRRAAPAHYTGQMNWRATVSRPPDVLGRHSYFGPTNKSGFNPISDRRCISTSCRTCRERPRWDDAELPAIMRGAAGRIRRRARPRPRRGRGARADHLPAGLLADPAAALAPRPRDRDRRCRAHHHAAFGERRRIGIEDSVVLARLLQQLRPARRSPRCWRISRRAATRAAR